MGSDRTRIAARLGRLWGLCALAAACADEPAPPVTAHDTQPALGFAPALIEVVFTPATVRPGDEVSYTLTFENRGDAPAASELSTFLHFEPEGTASCAAIEFQDDHWPAWPTTAWAAGRRVTLGPRILRVPLEAREGTWDVHAGLYDRGGGTPWMRGRLAGRFEIRASAPSSVDWQPQALPAEELERRRECLATRLEAPFVLQGNGWSYAQDRDGRFLLTDEHSGEVWSSDPRAARWGVLRVAHGEHLEELPFGRFERLELAPDGLHGALELACQESAGRVALEVDFEPVRGGRALQVSFHARASAGVRVEALLAFERGLCATDAEDGAWIQPRQVGYLLSARRGLPQERRYLTYDDISMAMFGLSKSESVLLLSWPDARTAIRTSLSVEDHPLIAGRRTQSVSIELAGDSGSFEVQPLGRGGAAELAQAYREVAESRGLVRTLAEKRSRSPRSEALDGAPIFRLCALTRAKPGSLFNPGPIGRSRVRYTFDEVARLAEHWRDELGFDRARIVLAGWNRAGYDNELPDVLPAAEACGGNAGLADAARRVRAAGFVLALQDNRQDMYRDAPGWNEALSSLDEAGLPRDGGLWEGGRATWICPVEQATLARRDWPSLRSELGAEELFLDTIFSVKLSHCSSAAHPLERALDLEHKRRLCALAGEHFELFSGEGGKEWGVPWAESFHGLLTSRTTRVEGRVVLPLFEMVYGDCVRLGTIMEDNVDLSDARKVLVHALYAQMPQFALDDHLYFESRGVTELALAPEVASFRVLGPTRIELGWRWRVAQDVHEDDRMFVHFRHPESRRPDGISFQDGFAPDPPTSTWRAGQVVELAPRVVELGPEQEGEWEILIGLEHDGERRTFADLACQRGRYQIGVLKKQGERLELVPGGLGPASRVFSRGDGGWSAELGPTDRTLKNVFELLSPLCRLTRDRRMSAQRFLCADRAVEETRFGDLTVTVNFGARPFAVGETLLGEFGVLVESPTFVAFHALARAGVEYPGGALFTLQSLDGLPLASAARVRVWHGFGERSVRVGERLVEVEREAVLELAR